MRIEESLKRGQGCGRDKIFVIGFNKTAGTTIAHLCMKNLLEARHQPNWGFSVGLGKNARGNFWDKFKCFSDGGDRENFQFLSQAYPDSLFVLNCRPIKDWLFSRFKHGVVERAAQQKNGTPPSEDAEIFRLEEDGTYRKFINEALHTCNSEKLKRWIKRNQEHHTEVVNYFSNHAEQLIITDISQPQWIQFLCEHSGLVSYDIYSNKRSAKVLNENDIKEFNTSLLEACDSLGIATNDLETSLFLQSSLNTSLNKSLQLIKNNLTFMIK